MSSNRNQYLILIVILGITVFNLYNMRQIKTDVEGFNVKIENIGKEIDSVQEMNKQLDGLIESLHSELELIDSDIDRVQNNIYTIRRNTNEKVNRVDSLTISELQEFFTKRYDSILKRASSEISN